MGLGAAQVARALAIAGAEPVEESETFLGASAFTLAKGYRGRWYRG
jgi:hypothetical protein